LIGRQYLTDKHDDLEATDRQGAILHPGDQRRPYKAPELIDYGTVAKLTQGGNGSFNDLFGGMRMMVCL
jgi:hypothetical protein